MRRCLCVLITFSIPVLAGPADGWLASAREALRAKENGTEGQSAARLTMLAAKPSYQRLLLRHEFMRQLGAEPLNQILAVKDGPAFLKALLADEAWLTMFLCSGPVTAPERCLRHLHAIWRKDRTCTRQRSTKSLATAVALEFGRRDWKEDRAWQRYTFYRDSARQELLHPVYDRLATWEKRFLAGHGLGMHGEADSQRWLRDNVKLPIADYRGACWQVAYRGHNLFGDSVQSWTYYFPFQGSFDSFTEMTRFVGGVCGRLSGYGAGAAVANGIPATTMGEPGHCAYAIRTAPGTWAPAYSLNWKRGVHVNLYGSSWNMLMLTDRMLAERAWQRASMHRLQARLHQPVARLTSLKRTVYKGDWQALPDFAKLKPTQTGKATSISPSVPGHNDGYGLLYTGEIACNTAGRYALALGSDDGSRLWVDGKMMIDNDGLHGDVTKHAELALTKGSHPFRLAYFQAGGGKALHLTVQPMSAAAESLLALKLAVRAQPLNYPAWDELGQALTRSKADGKDLRAYQVEVLKALQGYPEQAWQLVSRHAYPGLLKGMKPIDRLPILLAFHLKLDGWGPDRWNVEATLDQQAKHLGEDTELAFRFLGELLKAHAGKSVYFGPSLTWGLSRFGKKPEQRERFFATVSRALNGDADKGARAAILGMCSQALLAAEKAGDEDTFRAVGSLIDGTLEPLPASKPAFPGELLSKGAFVRISSVSKRYDRPWKHWLLPSDRPGFHHTDDQADPWIELRLRQFGEIQGIEVVNRDTHRARAIPLVIEVSEDGKTWQQVARWEKPDPSWRADLSKKPVRARFIRARKEGKACLHLVNFRIFGRRVS